MKKKFDVREFYKSLEVADVISLAGEKFITVLEKDKDNALTISCSSCPSFKLCSASPIRLDGEVGVIDKDGDSFRCFNEMLPELHEIKELTLKKGEGEEAVKWHHEIQKIAENHGIDDKVFSQLIDENKGIVKQVISLVLRGIYDQVTSDAQSLLQICGLHEAPLTNEKLVRLGIVMDVYAQAVSLYQKIPAGEIQKHILDEKLPNVEDIESLFNDDFAWKQEDYTAFCKENVFVIERLHDLMRDARLMKKTENAEAICRYIGLGEGELTKEKVGYFSQVLLRIMRSDSMENLAMGIISIGIGV